MHSLANQFEHISTFAVLPRTALARISLLLKNNRSSLAQHVYFTKSKMSVNVIIIGPPGSGVRTQALRLARHRPMPILSSGLLLREAVADAHSPLGRRAKLFLDAGKVHTWSHAFVPRQIFVIFQHSPPASPSPTKSSSSWSTSAFRTTSAPSPPLLETPPPYPATSCF